MSIAKLIVCYRRNALRRYVYAPSVRVAAKEIAATLGALGAYVTTVLPQVRRGMKGWHHLAEATPDPDRRRRILAALAEKRSNVEAVAVFATLAPLRQRAAVLRAIVPLQLAIDYRDTLEEAGEAGEGSGDEFLAALDAGWTREAEALPGFGAVAPLLRAAVERCGEGQRRTHAAAAGDSRELRRWAESLEGDGDYRWWELAAGASSSVAAHALIAAAADPAASAATAASIDAAYHPPIGALTVFLDDLVDLEHDRAAGEHSYLSYYASSAEAAERLAWIGRRAGAKIDPLPHASRHRAILAGVGAFYLSANGARTGFAEPIRSRLLAALGPGTSVLAAFVRGTARSAHGST
jgi:tetraprenyl-beta-curcumene synthase